MGLKIKYRSSGVRFNFHHIVIFLNSFCNIILIPLHRQILSINNDEENH